MGKKRFYHNSYFQSLEIVFLCLKPFNCDVSSPSYSPDHYLELSLSLSHSINKSYDYVCRFNLPQSSKGLWTRQLSWKSYLGKTFLMTGMALLERNRHAYVCGIWLVIKDGNLSLYIYSHLSWAMIFLYLEEITEVQIKDIRHLAHHWHQWQ